MKNFNFIYFNYKTFKKIQIIYYKPKRVNIFFYLKRKLLSDFFKPSESLINSVLSKISSLN